MMAVKHKKIKWFAFKHSGLYSIAVHFKSTHQLVKKSVEYNEGWFIWSDHSFPPSCRTLKWPFVKGRLRFAPLLLHPCLCTYGQNYFLSVWFPTVFIAAYFIDVTIDKPSFKFTSWQIFLLPSYASRRINKTKGTRTRINKIKRRKDY